MQLELWLPALDEAALLQLERCIVFIGLSEGLFAKQGRATTTISMYRRSPVGGEQSHNALSCPVMVASLPIPHHLPVSSLRARLAYIASHVGRAVLS